MNILVVPTIREKHILDFLDQWKNEPWDKIIIVEDNSHKTFSIPTNQNTIHYCWQDIENDLGDDSWIISRKDSAIRCYGFWKAYTEGATTYFTLDDDCYPLSKNYFVNQHEEALNSHTRWTESIPAQRTRGLPYKNMGKLNVVLNMGLWTGIPDFDSIQTLSNAKWEEKEVINRVIPPGQYFPLCFGPNTSIGLADGTSKYIKDIVPGDLVVTDNGEFHPVLRSMSRFVDEEVIEIKVASRTETFFATKNHQFLVNGHEMRAAADLKENDYLSVPLCKSTDSILSDSEMYALGVFLAEGSYRKSKYMKDDSKFCGVVFTMHKNEKSTIGQTLENFFIETHNKKPNWGRYKHTANALRMCVCGKAIANWFYKYCGEHSHSKRIHQSIITSQNLQYLLQGLFDGDGTYGYRNGTAYCKLKTTSKCLAEQTKFIINNLGFYCSIVEHKPKVGRVNYAVTLCGRANAMRFITEILQHDFNCPVGNREFAVNYRKTDKYLLHKVKKTTLKRYAGQVYNLTVENNHTYTVNNCVVKNCGMNVSFKREIAPLMYFPLMGLGQPYRRFDDIFCGIIMKKICDHLGLYVSVGEPKIHHLRASDPFKNLVAEAPGISTNETFWEIIDDILLTGTTPTQCMNEIGVVLSHNEDAYLSKLGRAIIIWAGLF